ncbi:hypothetical protein [Streptomyces sp. WM6373]|uniref:hypothetical protein n=1 Tax=Streptomyces sp. WM6373 TaxID=1415556 RepID=UPI003B642A8F
MAYAVVAGLPSVAGLWALLPAIVLYSLDRFLTAAVSATCATVTALALEPGLMGCSAAAIEFRSSSRTNGARHRVARSAAPLRTPHGAPAGRSRPSHRTQTSDRGFAPPRPVPTVPAQGRRALRSDRTGPPGECRPARHQGLLPPGMRGRK